ncbi:hypothetical protein ECC02_010254 [Trypanosoma cruzi]|uniref:Uncharacterized protein n=1 Tax=Trypanosoma cruzi TaxID=5693 RepID=A0A7J6XR31_TRYCR|nr:hypothetical protein ECC02_010254 [Trypanosoma cruzi]
MKQHNASKGAECRHPVRQRHAAILAMYEAQATKQLSSAIVIASSSFALFCSFGASSLSKAPAAAAVDHAAAAITPTERQGRVCGIVCGECSDCHRQRRPSWHRPSRASTHRAKHVLGSANTFLQSILQVLMCVWVSVGEAEKRRSTGRHIRTARGTAGWQRYMRCGLNTNNHARWQHTPIHKSKKRKKTRRQGVAVCVWRRGCLPALAARKQNKRERNVCSAPQALVARQHVTAPSARRSSRPLLMRAAGEAHRAVVMSVSVGVRVGQLGGKHTAPLTGRVQKKQLKEGRVERKKRSYWLPQGNKQKIRGREKKRKHKKRKELRRVIHYRMCVGVGEGGSAPH